MLFNSLPFILFYIIVTIAYFKLPYKFRWILLLAASCYFYMAFVPIYILILGFTIVIDYYAGIYLEKITDHRKRRRFLVMSLVANIGVLAVFKYYNFIAFNVNELFDVSGHTPPLAYLKILLPIGLSFHTFQAMSYTLEVYRGNQKAEQHFGIYALYVMFYPQLVAGPIERPQNVLHQFHEEHDYDFENLKAGLMQMATGFFKKVVIADRIAILVDGAYAHPQTQSGSSLCVAALFYGFQIYCDFSGYSDIALGAARTMGYNLMINFDRPFISTSVTEFWRRWHISLSTWFNDYLFTPIMIARRNWGKNAVVFALIVTFAISGLWHGAGWTFVIFGLLHGIAMVYEFKTKKFRKKLSKSWPHWLYNNLSIVITYLFACVTWVFFRSPYVHEAFYILGKIVHMKPFGPASFAMNTTEIFFSIGLIVLLCIKEKYWLTIPTKNTFWFFVIFILMVCSCYLFGVFNNKQFIYFQF
ncbi:D-alanyl-lipoteichoic acid acyltransferase DltB (MBOAT superfamily) [Mucilaginibacter yixingensis]|uniref:D-alanyl-lipoteichoic acid acyltransferase DltB (MBOAT superfamily) n=1 Tax=Mucilaginibacter yixingensis TaxID=1295612 RepID=A0A2T5J5R6_9SPHI|nr:MBOAT family O-acyltransferase [Mucilaginibacter yixingensis]PTQ93222.1 D-alanyl-lipoteichoic acid acyltransferase DltB (MBOAT superfamily) [Mucilaginibacter yixingensis]